MTKRETDAQRQRREAMDDRLDERAISEAFDLPQHIMRNPLAADDDPDDLR